MRFYLVQHGEAFSEQEDQDRPLTEKGRSDSLKCAEFLKRAGVSVDFIWHSPKERAKQTAEIFDRVLSARLGLLERQGFSPNDSVAEIFVEIQARKQDIMVVGHLPFLTKLASMMLTGLDAPRLIKFSLSGVVALEKDAGGNWQILFKVDPEILK